MQQGVHTHARVLVAIRRGALNGEEDLAPEVRFARSLVQTRRMSLTLLFKQHMPLATRIGMRLLYHGIDRGRVANSRRAEEVRLSVFSFHARRPLWLTIMLCRSSSGGQSAKVRRGRSQAPRAGLADPRTAGRKFDDDKHAYERIQAFVRTYNSA